MHRRFDLRAVHGTALFGLTCGIGAREEHGIDANHYARKTDTDAGFRL